MGDSWNDPANLRLLREAFCRMGFGGLEEVKTVFFCNFWFLFVGVVVSFSKSICSRLLGIIQGPRS